MEGFIILDYAPEFPEGVKQLATWLSQGKIKAKNTIIKGGLKQAEYALNDLFKGVNTGKFSLSVNWKLTGRKLTSPSGKMVVEVKEQ